MEKRWSRKRRDKPQRKTTPPTADAVRAAEPVAQTPVAEVFRSKPKADAPVEDTAAQDAPVRQERSSPSVEPKPQELKQVKDAAMPPVETRGTATTAGEEDAGRPAAPPVARSDIWESIPTFPLNVKHLERNRIITAERTDPAHSAFDVLRTKLLRMLKENGWSRIAVTSPTEGCGKTFMSANLALSLSRQANCRTILMDLDMRRPTVAKVLGIESPNSMGDFLRGDIAVPDLFVKAGQNELKIGGNIAIAPNGRREDYASELMQLPETADALNAMQAEMSPDVIIFDMPPALVNDDVLAARPLFDGVLLIIGGGITKPGQVRDVERRLGTETPLLGVVLNRSEGENAQSYSY